MVRYFLEAFVKQIAEDGQWNNVDEVGMQYISFAILPEFVSRHLSKL
jgi:hypothetical protein